MRVAVTRPVEDAERIAAPLRERGIDVLIEPLLAIVPCAGVEVDTTGIQAYLLTSANGVRALASAIGPDPARLSIPVLAVGDQTAAVARELGFTSVRAAEGDVTSLAALVRDSVKPGDGPLLHAAGSHVAGDLGGDLGRDGYMVRRVQLYESRAAAAFSDDFRGALKGGDLDAVLLYSPRTAKTFATLAKQDDLRDACSGVTAYCLSQAVADALGDLPFAAVRVAPRPEQDALLALFDDDNHDRFSHSAEADHHDPKGERTMSDRPEASGDKPKKQEAKDTPPIGSVPSTPDKNAPAAKGAAAGKDKEKSTGKAAEASAGKPGDKPVTAPPPDTKSTDGKPTGAKPEDRANTADRGADKDRGSSGGRGALVTIGAILLILLALYGSLPWWRDALPPQAQGFADAILPQARTDTALRDEVADLRDALGALRTSVQSLEDRVQRAEEQATAQQPAGDAASQEDLAALRQQVEQLAQAGPSEEVQALANRVQELSNEAASASAVLALSERVNQVEAQARDDAARRERTLAFLMATLQLREAVASGRPFDAELRAMRATAPQDVDVAAATQGFAEQADSGVAPLEVLRQRLAAQSDDIIRAAARPTEGDGWLNRTMDRALSVVSVSRTDGQAVGDGTAAVVARAEERLAAGNLAAAVGEMQALEGGPAEVAAPWLRDARARLAADAAVSDLTSEALARVTTRPQAASGQEG